MARDIDPNATVLDGAQADPGATVLSSDGTSPAAQSATQSAAQAATQSATQSATQAATQSATQSATQAATQSAQQPAASETSSSAPYAAPASSVDWVGRFWPEWRIVKPLGAGSYGSVYEIEKTSMGYTTKAAAKIILIPHELALQMQTAGATQADRQEYARLARRTHDEIRVMSELSGERNIVIIQDSCVRERDDAPGYALGIRMELLESLPNRMKEFGSLFPVDEAVRAAMDVCRGLITCHGRHILHRDVKPENVFWSNNLGEYKLGDFGIAKQLSEGTQTWGVRTSIGTPQYEAPEVYLHQEYSYNADVYSLGVVLFRLLNYDRPPFAPLHPQPFSESQQWAAEGRRISGERFDDPARGDEYLADVVRSATAGNPKHRFKSAQAFYNALEAWPG